MADGKLNNDDCTIGLSQDGMIAIITIPIHKYALNETDGTALIYGKIRELQAHLMQIANKIRLKRTQLNGLLKPLPDLKVG